MASNCNVVVLGAGVIGLTTALLLAEEGYKVTVIAKNVPGDQSIEYASPWAGAHWRSHATSHEPEQCDWDLQTYQYWLDLMQREEKESAQRPELLKSGIKMYDQFHYWDGPVADELWWAPYVKAFTTLNPAHEPHAHVNRTSPSHMPPVANAVACRSMTVNVPRYLLYLQKQLQAQGGVIFKSALPTDGGLAKATATAEGIAKVMGRGKVHCFVNATGLGARKLCGDEAMYPIRGQTILVKGEAQAIRIRTGKGYVSYCIPRSGSGTTILGGTKEIGNWSAAVDQQTTEQILRYASYMVPELLTAEDGGFEVVSVQCGLRPARRGGPRTEKEVLREGAKVVHSYGHAGAGYQNSIGAARQTVRLVAEMIGAGAPRIRSERL